MISAISVYSPLGFMLLCLEEEIDHHSMREGPVLIITHFHIPSIWLVGCAELTFAE